MDVNEISDTLSYHFQVYKLTEKCLDACEQNPGFVRGDNAIRFREVAEQVELGELAMTAKKKLVLCFFDFLHSESLLQLDYIEIGWLCCITSHYCCLARHAAMDMSAVGWVMIANSSNCLISPGWLAFINATLLLGLHYTAFV